MVKIAVFRSNAEPEVIDIIPQLWFLAVKTYAGVTADRNLGIRSFKRRNNNDGETCGPYMICLYNKTGRPNNTVHDWVRSLNSMAFVPGDPPFRGTVVVIAATDVSLASNTFVDFPVAL
jgi:hypothetical protein